MTDKTAEEQRAEAYELIAKAMGVEALRPDDQYFLDTLNLRRLPRVQAMIEEGVKNHTNGVLADVEEDVLAGLQLTTIAGEEFEARAKLAAIQEMLEVKKSSEVPTKGVQKLINDLLAIIESGDFTPDKLAEAAVEQEPEPFGFDLEVVHA